MRQRFKRLARRFHPDVNRSPEAIEQFRRVRRAYEVLTDPRLRQEVDAWYTTPKRGARRKHRPRSRPEPGPTPRPGPRPEPRRASRPEPTIPPIRTRRASPYGNDRAWSFGCFGLVAFLLALLGGLLEGQPAQNDLLLTAAIVGLVVGCIAALGGARIREWLLWILFWAWRPWSW